MTSPRFTVAAAEYARDHARLHALRTTVFVHGQRVPAGLERDALDPLSFHVLAEADDGTLLGTARLTPERRIGRMAVLEQARGHGIGAAMLEALVAEARRRGWPEVALHAQLHALAARLAHVEESTTKDREKAFTEIERVASSLVWRLQRLETRESTPA